MLEDTVQTAAKSTTILAVKCRDLVAMGGDGQVTLGETIVKHHAQKIRRLSDGRVLVGFAGSAADSMALMERFEAKLKECQGSLVRASIELAKNWRMDKMLRRLESVIVAADREHLLLLSGAGDVIEPDEGIVGIGSGGAYAACAARALVKHTRMTAPEIAAEAIRIASDVCVYTNGNVVVEELSCAN